MLFSGEKRTLHTHSDGKQGSRGGSSPEDGETHLKPRSRAELTAHRGRSQGGRHTDISQRLKGPLPLLSRQTQPHALGTQGVSPRPDPRGKGQRLSIDFRR